MTEQIVQSVAVICAFVAFGALLIAIARKAAAQNRPAKGEEEEEFINIALCETKHGICTHYHEIGVEPLNYGGYPIHGHPTLCGAEVGWDMKNQDCEATCTTCREALAKMAGENDAPKQNDRSKIGMPG
jgi:hypothetical protein